jgi:transcriptional regulator with XRE-family HTH domain
MQKLRIINGATGKQVAKEFGCSPSHISRVEQGSSKPSRELVQFYEVAFQADGLLLSLFEVAEHAPEQDRRGGAYYVVAPCGRASNQAGGDSPGHGTAQGPDLRLLIYRLLQDGRCGRSAVLSR